MIDGPKTNRYMIDEDPKYRYMIDGKYNDRWNFHECIAAISDKSCNFNA